GMTLHVLWIDHFGNLITDLRPEQQPDGKPTLTLHGQRIASIARTFADVDDGEPVAYFGSSGRLEIAVRNGSAAQRWGVKAGDAVELVMR
ncbi:MAG: SAM hydroxide adenosyltransferase, partial [Phycisphaeraceae bacterium]